MINSHSNEKRIKVKNSTQPFLFLGLLLCFLLATSASGQTRVLVLPLTDTNIVFGKPVEKMLVYNDENFDRLKRGIADRCLNRISYHFPEFEITNILDLPNYANLMDSLGLVKQWHTFHISKIDSAKGLEKVLLLNENDFKSKYYGRIMSDTVKQMLKNLMEEEQFDYVIAINRFETHTMKPFSNETEITIHFEIYDADLLKLIGNRVFVKRKIKKKMYVGAFIIYVHTVIDKLYSNLSIED